MTSITVDIPVLETDRLILRAPQMSDGDVFAEFLTTDRSFFVGGPGNDRRAATRAFGHMVGLWVMRGYSSHVWTLKDSTVIGHGGPWYPATWPEPEFGWLLYDAIHEGKGYAVEAMTALRDWTWAHLGLSTCVAYIDPDNHASASVAKRLGGRIDTDTTTRPSGNENADVWRFHPDSGAHP